MSYFELLNSSETMLEGKWDFLDGKVVADFTCQRIRFLIKNTLIKLTTDESGWDTLYQDSKDGRYWEVIFLHSGWHGGGPEALRLLDANTAKQKYKLI